jgi:hypothetical protein
MFYVALAAQARRRSGRTLLRLLARAFRRWCAQWSAQVRQVGEDFGKRPQARCLMVGDGLLLTKGSHHRLGFL